MPIDTTRHSQIPEGMAMLGHNARHNLSHTIFELGFSALRDNATAFSNRMIATIGL
jgi:hypothetical protein